MLSSEQLAKIKNLADEVSRREGCRLYDLEFSGGTQRTLRVYIDNETSTVSIEQCANVSRGLSLLLDMEDLVAGTRYELEVSSPGVDRLLREPWHFEVTIGKVVKVITHDPISELKGEVKSIQATLTQVLPEGIQLENETTTLIIPFVNIKKAQVVFEYKTKEKKR